jgi:hypothetical protein
VVLCVVPCFADYHTKTNLQSSFITTSVCVCVCIVWRLKNDSRCHGTSAAARIMWVIKYLHYILYTACNREA